MNNIRQERKGRMIGLKMVSTGSYLPPKRLTNDDLTKIVDTSDEWITTRTGIKERRICDADTAVSMAAAAGARALQSAGIDKNQIGALVVTTFASELCTPSVASLVQRELGLAEDMPAFDVNAACSGFLYGLQVVRGLLLQSERPYALIIASETLSKVTDYTDRGTCILFGDGAGAAVVTLSSENRYYSVLGSRGNDELIHCGGPSAENRKLYMNGREVFRFAVEAIPHCITDLLHKADLTMQDIDWVVCHQANKRIIDSAIKRLNADPEKFYVNLEKYGNTSSASIPIALDEMNRQGLLRRGMKMICVGFGAGLTWAGVLLEW